MCSRFVSCVRTDARMQLFNKQLAGLQKGLKGTLILVKRVLQFYLHALNKYSGMKYGHRFTGTLCDRFSLLLKSDHLT
jgi:hypothetical protein